MSTYKGIPFNGGMDSPTGTGAQHIVQTCKALCDFLQQAGTPGQLLDAANLLSLDWNARQFSDANGFPTVDYQQCQLLDDNGFTTVLWAGNLLTSSLDANQSINWGTRQLWANGNIQMIDYEAGKLTFNLGTWSIDWINSLVQDVAGRLSIDWFNRYLANTGSGPTLDWQNQLLIDGVQGNIINWTGGLGFFNHAPTTQQAGGAHTAGATYTANEQTMLNTLYAMARAYGLIT